MSRLVRAVPERTKSHASARAFLGRHLLDLIAEGSCLTATVSDIEAFRACVR
jgi:hypothetical protein